MSSCSPCYTSATVSQIRGTLLQHCSHFINWHDAIRNVKLPRASGTSCARYIIEIPSTTGDLRMKKTLLVATLIFGALLYGCGDKAGSTSEPWMAEIYPDASTPSKSRSLGQFRTYDACVTAAMEALGGDGVFNCSLT